MTAIRTGTEVEFGIVPFYAALSTAPYPPMQHMNNRFTGNFLISANTPMIYQVQWTGTSVNENYTPSATGDVINVVFEIYATTESPVPSPSFSNWDLIGEISKKRDVVNTNIVNSTVPNVQSFTIDIASMVSDELSYSLVPIGKGSWQNQEYGGLNGGGAKQDNITETVSPYNVSRNGTYRTIKVDARLEVLDSSGLIVTSSTGVTSAPSVRVVNSVPNFKAKLYSNQMWILSEAQVTTSSQRRALTTCPNSSVDTSSHNYMKPISITDEAEFLYFFCKSSYNGNDDTDNYNRYEVYGRAYNKDGGLGENFVLGSDWQPSDGTSSRICSDISHNFIISSANANHFAHDQNQMCVQNVSPAYINGHAYTPNLNENYPYTSSRTPITSFTDWYYVYVRGYYDTNTIGWQEVRHSNVYWYKMDESGTEKSAYENVRFHWLNTMGGIDSYTARRDVLESISVEKSLMQTALPNRKIFQDNQYADDSAVANSAYYSDTMRGSNYYRGGKEVLSVNANANNSVYTEPLNKIESTWLREMFTSPNVWIETPTADSDELNYESDAGSFLNDQNPYLRPSTTVYTPVILTNTEITSLNEKEGLVMFNIEYTLSQGILTQRN
tara:strand:- start:3984 stop:5819 length:1836 start_codon:yes stop_codon:yes gene_type:complete